MATWTYDDALARLLAHEGGYTNHPSDPGGPTNWGITIHDARLCWKAGATAADVKAMPLSAAKAIYRAKYWDAQRCDELPAGLDYAVFDYGVNSGIGRSGKVLRRMLALPDATHVVSDAVIAAAGKCDPATAIEWICDERLAFLKRLKTWPVFGKGWERRVRELRGAALAMARGAGPVPPSQVRKDPAPVNSGAQAGTAGAIVVAGGAAAAQSDDAVIIAIVLVATIVIAVTAILVWRRWHRQEQEG